MKKYRVKEGETIWTVANSLYGSVNYAFKIASDNGLNINDSLSGLEVDYDETIKNSVLQPFTIVVKTINSNQIYIGLSNQTIFDIQLQTGSDSIITLLKNSNMKSLNEDATNKQFSYAKANNAVSKYIGLTGRVFGNKPIPSNELLREHDDSFNRLQYT